MTLQVCPALDAWHTQLDGIVQPYLEVARRRREQLTVVLCVDADGKVQPAKVTVKGR